MDVFGTCSIPYHFMDVFEIKPGFNKATMLIDSPGDTEFDNYKTNL
jgi:hypothetical protein